MLDRQSWRLHWNRSFGVVFINFTPCAFLRDISDQFFNGMNEKNIRVSNAELERVLSQARSEGLESRNCPELPYGRSSLRPMAVSP